ncbi:hypothetical protein IFM89_023319, partial [Coptis chinensis]
AIPGDEVLPPSIERKAGRPRKQRIRGDNEERATSKRKCRKCKEPGHNSRTCPHGKSGQNGKKQKNTSDCNEIECGVEAEGENVEPIVDVQQQQEDTQVHNVDDIPRTTRGGRRAGRKGGRGGGSQNVNVDQPPNETQVNNVHNEILRGGGRGGSAGRRGGRGGRATGKGVGWWIGIDEEEPETPSTPGPSNLTPALSECLTQSQP